jgi:hypothetical protein
VDPDSIQGERKRRIEENICHFGTGRFFAIN